MRFACDLFMNRRFGMEVTVFEKVSLVGVHGAASLMKRLRLFHEWPSYPMTGLAFQIMAFRMDKRVPLSPFYPYHLLRTQIVLPL